MIDDKFIVNLYTLKDGMKANSNSESLASCYYCIK